MNTLWLKAAVLALVYFLGGLTAYSMLNPRLSAEKATNAALSKAADTLAKQRKDDQATLTLLAKKNAVAARESASARARLAAAIASSTEWGDTPVPQEVQDALK